MPAIAACTVIATISSGLMLGFYAISKMKPRWLRVHVSLWRLLTFNMEIGVPDRKPHGQLPPGQDPDA